MLGRDIVTAVDIGGTEVVLCRYMPEWLDPKMVDGALVPRHLERPMYFIPTLFPR